MSTTVICIVNTRPQAENLVAALKAAGIGTMDISVLFPGDHAGAVPASAPAIGSDPAPTQLPGLAAGGVIGGVLGLLAGIGILAIPGAGPYVAAGPIISALGGAAMGAAVGGIAGGLIWLGVPEQSARKYEARVRSGGILVSVHTHNLQAVRRARAIMDAVRAERISQSCELPPPPIGRFADMSRAC